jgi:hypothetical protein
MSNEPENLELVAVAKKIRNSGKWRSKAIDNVKQVDYFSGTAASSGCLSSL